jgi:hypothetical protein
MEGERRPAIGERRLKETVALGFAMKEKERALVFSEERSKLKKLKKRWFAGFFSIYQLNRW